MSNSIINGTKIWYKINEYGDMFWNNDNGSHREDGPARQYSSGRKEWWINGKLHREDGPAIETADGNKYWYLNNRLHREDGPAIEAHGNNSWWYKGRYIDCKSQEEFECLIKLELFW